MPYITVTLTDPPTPPQTTDPDNFDSRADSFLTYIDDDLYNELVSFKTQANDLRDEVNTSRDTAVDAKDTAVSAKTTAQTYRDESYDWAEGDENVSVNDTAGHSGYSAYHWAQKTAKGERLTATSSSSVTIGTGSKTFTLAESYRAFTVGSQVRVVDGANPATNYLEGTVTSYDDSTDELVVDVSNAAGSGTISNWYIGLDHGGDAYSVGGLTAEDIKKEALKAALVLG